MEVVVGLSHTATALKRPQALPPLSLHLFSTTPRQLCVTGQFGQSLDMASMTTLKGDKFDRQLFESVIKRRFFFTEVFEIYRLSPNFKGDNRGLFDYGPPGCVLQANIVDAWRKHFVLRRTC